MHFASLHGQERTQKHKKIILLIYVDGSCICGYTCAHTSAHRIVYTHPNERTKRISERTKRASEPSELNESDESYYWMNLIAFANQVISSESNNRIQIIMNQTNRHIGLTIWI